jgi:hypothetical protein
VQRLGFYAQDSWRVTPHLTVNYGLRYDTTFGLFTASGRSQLENPALLTVEALDIPLFQHGARRTITASSSRRALGLAYAMGDPKTTVLRAGFGMFYNDLAQNGWVTAFQAVNEPPGVCVNPGDPGCLPGAANGGAGALIDPAYKTPYALARIGGRGARLQCEVDDERGLDARRRRARLPALRISGGLHAVSPLFASDMATQEANVPNITVFRTDNRSRYDGMSVHLQGQHLAATST